MKSQKTVNSQNEIQPVVLSQKETEHIKEILARTDWTQYWKEVSVGVEREVEAYASARAKSLVTASRRFLR